MRKLKKAAVFLMSLALILGMGNVRVAAAENTTVVQLSVEYRQSVAREVLSYVNTLRTGGSWQWDESNTNHVTVPAMDALTYDYTLEQIAMQRAAELAVSYSHTRPNGEDCFTAYTGSWQMKGENIAYGYNALETADTVYNAWLEENEDYAGQGHRRNMLESRFTAIGMGCVYYNGYIYWAMELGTPSGEINTSDPGVADETRTVDIEVPGSENNGEEGGNTPPGGDNEGGNTPPGGDNEGGNTPPSGDNEGGNTPSGGDEGGNIPDADEGGSSSDNSGNSGSVSNDYSDDDSDSNGGAVVNVDWNAVSSNLSSALKDSKAQDIAFAVGDNTEIPVDILSRLAGSKATLALQSGSGLTVTVSGRDVKKVGSPLTVSISGAVNIPASIKQKVVSGNAAASREFTIGDPGAYPIAVHMNLGKANAGKQAVLYYYDEAAGIMKSAGSFTITESGQAMFGVRRGGQYIAVVSGQSVQNGGNYTVVQGDTLYGIARKGGVNIRALREANPQITDLNKIYPGQKIIIP